MEKKKLQKEIKRAEKLLYYFGSLLVYVFRQPIKAKKYESDKKLGNYLKKLKKEGDSFFKQTTYVAA